VIALVQRVRDASVEIERESGGKPAGRIGRGLLVLLGVQEGDTADEATWLARKTAHLRVFPDDAGKMDRSLLDDDGEALVVPQFTLCGEVRSGHRPSFSKAAAPSVAEPLYEAFVERLGEHLNRPVPTGVFGAAMQVHLTNDGPVTLWVEKQPDG
jgi:D-tyrosyl-tRNA(Tyr) deacylase